MLAGVGGSRTPNSEERLSRNQYKQIRSMSVIETIHTNPDFAVRMMRKKSQQDSANNVKNQLKLLKDLRDDQLKSQGSDNAL